MVKASFLPTFQTKFGFKLRLDLLQGMTQQGLCCIPHSIWPIHLFQIGRRQCPCCQRFDESNRPSCCPISLWTTANGKCMLIVLWFCKSFANKSEVNFPALPLWRRLILQASPMGKPSVWRDSRKATIFSNLSRTSTEVLVARSLTSMRSGKPGSLRAPTRK